MGKFRIGEFEELLVLAVAGLGDDAYCITIQRRLEKQAKRFVPLGAIYAALIRLEEKGLLKSKWGGISLTIHGLPRTSTRCPCSGGSPIAEIIDENFPFPCRIF